MPLNINYFAKFLVLVLISLVTLTGCDKNVTTEADKKKLSAFEQRAHEIRQDVLHNHPYDAGNLRIADSLYQESQKMNSDYGKMRALQIKYYYYVAQTDKDKEFIEVMDEFLALAKSNPEFSESYYDGVNVAVNYYIGKNKFAKAKDIAKEAMALAEKSNDADGLYYSNINMATIYQSRDNFKLAIPYLEKAEKYAEDDSIKISLVSKDLAGDYGNSKQYDKALKYAVRCRNYAPSEVYKIWGEYTYLSTLFEADKETQFIKAYSTSILQTANLDNVLPAYMQNKIKIYDAICNKDWDRALSLANTIEYAVVKADILYEIYKHKGDYQKALEARLGVEKLQDDAQQEMQTSELSEMDARLGNSQLKIQSEELKLRNQHMYFVTAIIVLLAILAFAGFIMFQRFRHRAEMQKRKIMQERELFYRNVTHQLRTPMTVVMGMVNQIKSHVVNGVQIDMETVEAAERQSNNLMQLIKQLIEASKEGTLNESLLSPNGDLATSLSAAQPTSMSAVKGNFDSFSEKNAHSILVAEDNNDVALLICNMLHDEGYNVKRACDGQEAWEMLQEELPDMLLTDIAMPRMDGLELMRFVRRDITMSHLPIIVVSARVEDHERIEGINAGAEVYLAKPFINEELLLRVRKLIQQREFLKARFSGNDEEVETVVKEGLDSDEKDFMDKFNSILDASMVTGDISVTYISERFSTSLSTLNRRLKNITGMSATTYIRMRRIAKAKSLLSHSDKTIAEIETLCGFNTAGHFSRIFKAELGVSPSDYRLQNQKDV